jgi:hypothetical protein
VSWLRIVIFAIFAVLLGGWQSNNIQTSDGKRVPGSCTILGLLSVEGDDVSSPDHISLKLMCLVLKEGKEHLSTKEELIIRPDDKGRYPLPYPETHVFMAAGSPNLSFMLKGERTSASLIKTREKNLWSFVHLKKLIEEEE